MKVPEWHTVTVVEHHLESGFYSWACSCKENGNGRSNEKGAPFIDSDFHIVRTGGIRRDVVRQGMEFVK